MLPIRTDSGLHLSYVLDVPKPLSKDLVVVVHGFACTKDDKLYEELAKGLKFNSLRIDLPGNGKSEGVFSLAGYLIEVEAVQAAVTWADHLGFRVISLIGHSKGGNVVLMHSALHPGVPSIISLAARFDMSGTFGRMAEIFTQALETGEAFFTANNKTFKIDREAVQERFGLDMRSLVKKVSANVLLIHGTSDEIIPFKDSESILEALEVDSKRLDLLPNSDHFFSSSLCELIEKINEFLSTNP